MKKASTRVLAFFFGLD